MKHSNITYQTKTEKQLKEENISYWQAVEQRYALLYSLDTYISKEIIKSWKASPTSKKGRPAKYSELAYLTVLQLKEAFQLPLRGAEHFLRSHFRGNNIDLEVPDHVSLSRALNRLNIPLVRRTSKNKPRCVIIDSTGLKIFGANEWNVHKHELDSKSKYVKVHKAMDYETGEILAFSMTDSKGEETGDSSQLPVLLDKIVEDGYTIGEVIADGAYDTEKCYKKISEVNAKACIPPQWNANYGLHPLRDKNVKIMKWHGVKEMRRRLAYGRRSTVESSMNRLVNLNPRLTAKSKGSRVNQLALRLSVLNTMLAPGNLRRKYDIITTG